MESRAQAEKGSGRQNRLATRRRDADRTKVGKYVSHVPRKAAIVLVIPVPYPYRKPTQVGEERILRPTEEALLRNSAKQPRNFGRRGASVTGGRSDQAQATV